MAHKRLTTLRLSALNLRGGGYHATALVFVVAVLSYSLLAGSIISSSLANGIETAKDRLGADIAVIPAGCEAQYEGVILSGEPIWFYLDKSVETRLADIAGVERVAGQFFLTSVSADCCSLPVQIIGINPDTDFVTMPWIADVYEKGLCDGQFIIGSDIFPDPDNTLTFYGQKYDVAAVLEKSGAGMDLSVFTTENSVRELASAARERGFTQNADVADSSVDDSLSVVHLKVADGYDPAQVALDIRREVDGVDIVRASRIFTGLAEKLDIFSSFISSASWALLLLAVAVLAALYSFGVNARKREFAVLRLMGATRRRVVSVVFCESVLVSILGNAIGLSLAALTVFPFSTYIGDRLGLPFLLPDGASIAAAFIFSLASSLAAGTLSAVFAAVRISRAETYITMREGE